MEPIHKTLIIRISVSFSRLLYGNSREKAVSRSRRGVDCRLWVSREQLLGLRDSLRGHELVPTFQLPMDWQLSGVGQDAWMTVKRGIADVGGSAGWVRLLGVHVGGTNGGLMRQRFGQGNYPIWVFTMIWTTDILKIQIFWWILDTWHAIFFSAGCVQSPAVSNVFGHRTRRLGIPRPQHSRRVLSGRRQRTSYHFCISSCWIRIVCFLVVCVFLR